MIFQKHCPGCFTQKSGLAICPHCGYDESAPRSALFLPHGLVLGGQYRVGRVLGKPGGFGITYLAWDVHLQQRVAIKEYLPRELAARAPDSAEVRILGPEQDAPYRAGLEHFLHEARLIARFDHPNIMRVRNFFRAHGSAYLVMDYYEGRSLGDYLHEVEPGSIEPEAAVRLLAPVLEGLQFVHERGIVHRDVKPHNIYLASGGRTILLDFGAARQAQGADGDGAAVVISEGYAPAEQYQREGEQGPWTDVYGVAATLYRLLRGQAPPPALDRIGADPLEQAMGLGPTAFEAVLRKGLALRRADRYASAADFRDDLARALALGELDAPAHASYSAPPVPSGSQDGDTTTRATRTLPRTRTLARNGRAGLGGLRGALVLGAAIVIAAAMVCATLWWRLGCS